MYEYSTPGERRGTLRAGKDDLRLLLSNMLQVKLGLLGQPDDQQENFRAWFDGEGAPLVREQLESLAQERLEKGEGMEVLVDAYQAYQQKKILH